MENMIFLGLVIEFATLCIALIALAATNINKHKLDVMIGVDGDESLETRLIQLSQSHERLAASVTALQITVNTIIAKLT